MFILKAALVIISSRKIPFGPHVFLTNSCLILECQTWQTNLAFPPLSISVSHISIYIFIYLTGGKCPLLVFEACFLSKQTCAMMMTPLSMLKNKMLPCSMCGCRSITLYCAVFELWHAISFFSFSSFLLHEVQGYFFSFFYLFFYISCVRTHLNFVYCWRRT
jgi:hypothetical protein